MKLKIKTELTLDVPRGTKVIRNDDWLTLARRDGFLFKVFTLHIDDVGGTDFNYEGNWVQYDRDEITALLKV